MSDAIHFSVRRIVTGHDEQGRAVVKEDVALPAQQRLSELAGGSDRHIYAAEIWGTAERPVDNDDARIEQQRKGGRDLPAYTKGTRSQFRIVGLPAGHASPIHRTETVDYGILLEGECSLVLDGGEEIHCRAGDVVIQRGTLHSWINRSDRPCRWAWVLIDADPVVVGDRTLEQVWSQAAALD